MKFLSFVLWIFLLYLAVDILAEKQNISLQEVITENFKLRGDTITSGAIIHAHPNQGSRHYMHTENRTGAIEYIVVHMTANTKPWADANWHAQYIDTTRREVSWHYSVDDTRIVEHFPLDLVCYHAGNREMNHMSIGIEMCEQDGYDKEKMLNNLFKLLAYLKGKLPEATLIFHDQVQGVTKACPGHITEVDRKLILTIFNNY